ncbi:hypothetical protein V6N13_072624 [Hibiscus sabdariffa]
MYHKNLFKCGDISEALEIDQSKSLVDKLESFMGKILGCNRRLVEYKRLTWGVLNQLKRLIRFHVWNLCLKISIQLDLEENTRELRLYGEVLFDHKVTLD